MLYYTLFDIVGYLISIVITLVIVQFVMYLLLQFNVINSHNRLVQSIWNAVSALLDPILTPIRRLMPDTGGLDFSPMVLIILLTILQKILLGLAVASLQ